MPTEKDEFERYRVALDAPIPTPPGVETQSGYLAAAFASRKSEDEVQSHFEALWVASCGQALQSLQTMASTLQEHIGALAAQATQVRVRREGRIRHVTVDSKGPAQWNLSTVIDMGVPLAQCVGLLLVGWICAMATLEEAADIYEVFDSWTNRATFTLLPALGLCAGWKMLGTRVAHAKRNAYWAWVTRLGIVLGIAWVVLFGLTMGGTAWDISDGGSGGGIPIGESSGGGISLGVWLVITGILAETLIAAACWRRFETELHAVFPYEVVEDPLTVAQDDAIEELNKRRADATELHGEFLGAAAAMENAKTVYADDGVAAMAPTWSQPRTEETHSAPPANPNPSPASGHRRNGNLRPGMENV